MQTLLQQTYVTLIDFFQFLIHPSLDLESPLNFSSVVFLRQLHFAPNFGVWYGEFLREMHLGRARWTIYSFHSSVANLQQQQRKAVAVVAQYELFSPNKTLRADATPSDKQWRSHWCKHASRLAKQVGCDGNVEVRLAARAG